MHHYNFQNRIQNVWSTCFRGGFTAKFSSGTFNHISSNVSITSLQKQEPWSSSQFPAHLRLIFLMQYQVKIIEFGQLRMIKPKAPVHLKDDRVKPPVLILVLHFYQYPQVDRFLQQFHHFRDGS